ncbi:MAG: hypothetical protein V3S19_05790, partial [Gemmatimonadales bacterium]
ASVSLRVYSCLTDHALSEVPVARAPKPARPTNETRIAIDGDPSEWAARPLLKRDAKGDAPSGQWDLTTVRAFVNQDALYMMAEGSGGVFTEIQFDVQTADRTLRFGWEDGDWPHPWSADITDEWVSLPDNRTSTFASGNVVEGRIDLRSIGTSDFEITQIVIFAGECCDAGYVVVDELDVKVQPVALDEIDPPVLTARLGSTLEAETKLAAPDTRAISVEFDPSSWQARVTGGADAVPPGSWVVVADLEVDDFRVLQADGEGAFEATVMAAPGTHILIKQDADGRYINSDKEFGEDLVPPGVVLKLPVAESGSGVAFGAGAGLCCDTDVIPTWSVQGTIDRTDLEPGDEFRARGQVFVHAGPSVRPKRSSLDFMAYLISDEGGRQVGRSGKFITPFLTATGLPVERTLENPGGGRIRLGHHEFEWRFDGSRWVGDFDTRLELPRDIRRGLFVVVMRGFWELGAEELEPLGNSHFGVTERDAAAREANIGLIAVGGPEPTRLTTVILADEVSEGTRGGVIAREDEGLFAISSRATTHHNPVIPRLDPYGDPWAYRLEPFVPMIDVVDRDIPNPPAIDLDLTRSELMVTVERPDGRTDVLGPAPMTRYAVKSPVAPWGATLGSGGGELREVPQLQGDDQTFAYRFPADGNYVVRLEGQVAGVDGRVYGICGTYDVVVANVLDVESGVLPGTPMEVGDTLAPTVTVFPGMPTEVTYDLLHVAADGQRTTRSLSGVASSGGYWDGNGEAITFTRDGEYRVDIEARGSDDDGNLWVGRLSFGSVVMTPDAPIVAHGRRGPDGLTEIAPPWAPETAFVTEESAHMQFPYFTGDVLWGVTQSDSGDAVVTHASIQVLDPNNDLVKRAVFNTEQFGWFDRPSFDELERAGQIPLITGAEPSQSYVKGGHPDDIDLWAYVYTAAQRPGVRVREAILGDDVSGSYWRFGDPYHGQSGNGPEGDLPGDFKYFYISAVIRDDVSGEGIYAGYGSGWVHARDDDPRGSRFMPPFRGAAGGPDGGPLFTVHGREVNIFFLPTSVRPGSLLHTGDAFRMSGPVMPTLPSLVDYTVTAPDGTVRSLGGQANAIGYFYDPDDDFVLDQAGIWTVDLGVTHEGLTSAGQVEAPFPTGGPLTPDGKTFTFTVMDDDTELLDISSDLEERGPARWFENVDVAVFEADLPAGWSGDKARIVVTIPGIVLVDREVSVTGGTVRWEMVPRELNLLANNFDDMYNIADTVTVTFYAEDSTGGQTTRAAGTMVTHGARVPVAPVEQTSGSG